MTRKEFRKMTEKPVLLDGATGSNLFRAGMPKNVCTEKWVLEHKDVILQLQRSYVEAGSQMIYAPTFGGNRINLTHHGLADELVSLNTALVSYSREAADGKALVGGDITTTGQMLEPFGDMSPEEAYEIYREQVRCLDQAGVDFIVAETMISIEEAIAAIKAARDVCSLPILCTVTVDKEGKLFTGGTAWSAAKAFEEAGADAAGINCSVGPDQLEAVVKKIRETVSLPVIAKPNAGTPTIDSRGNAVYHMEAPEFVRHMRTLIRAGAGIVGGCCGTTPEFIRELHEELRRG